MRANAYAASRCIWHSCVFADRIAMDSSGAWGADILRVSASQTAAGINSFRLFVFVALSLAGVITHSQNGNVVLTPYNSRIVRFKFLGLSSEVGVSRLKSRASEAGQALNTGMFSSDHLRRSEAHVHFDPDNSVFGSIAQ